MSIVTLEGIVEQGQIKLLSEINLPEHTRVYVIVPTLEPEPTRRIYSPRLVHPEQAQDFQMQVIEEPPNAKV